MADGYNYNAHDSVRNLNNVNPPRQINLFSFLLEDTAELTDCISSALSPGLILSDKFLQLFLEEKIKGLVSHEVGIIHKNKSIMHYSWVNIYDFQIQLLDFKACEFMIKGRLGNPDQKIEINSFEDLIKVKSELGGFRKIRFTQLKFSPNFNVRSSVFKIGGFDFSFYVSDSFKTKCLDHGISGIEFEKSKIIA